ncbi:MAG: response regulator [Acidobacteria bacterium]|nr:response regulator [Acidobacteriota bacterium]
MVTAQVAIALLSVVTTIAVAAACLATLRARAARAALRAADQTHSESAERARKTEADRRVADDVAHDLSDLLTAITGHAELLIASLDPSGTSIQDAHEIRRAALSAARLTRPLRTIGGGERAPAGVIARRTTPVLVVEDEPGMRELIRLVLVRAGHEVVTVAGPHAALAALHRLPATSLMLVDVVMPEMDGYDLVAEARKISPGVHVVYISAFAPDPTRHPSGDGFLAKPFTSESLIGIVERALSG